MREKPTNTPVINSVYYVWYLLHVSALHCHPQGAFTVPSERCSIEEQSIEYCGGCVVSSDVVRGDLRWQYNVETCRRYRT
jgi:hypothetical protein